MAECCAVSFHLDLPSPYENALRLAIEAGNREFFIREAAWGRQATAANQSITVHESRFFLIQYAALRGKAELLSYLADPLNGWTTHCDFTTLRSLELLHLYAFYSGNVACIKLTTQWLQAKTTVSGLRYPSSTKKAARAQSVLHLAASHVKTDEFEELFTFLVKTPGMPSPPSWRAEDLAATPWIDNKGNNPLHYAAAANNLPALKYLIEKLRIPPLLKNNKGKTAFDLIRRNLLKESPMASYARRWKENYERRRTLFRGLPTIYGDKISSELIRNIISYVGPEASPSPEDETRTDTAGCHCTIQ